MKQKILFATLAFVFATITILSAQTNPKLSIQGILREANGRTVADGDYELVFNIYDQETGGTSLWTETHSTVPITNGLYAVKLGGTSTLTILDFTVPYFVGVTIGSSELSPRIELTYAPYSIKTLVDSGGACTGAIGDVKYSTFNEATFTSYNGSCWVPMDGRNITGSQLATDMGWTNVPDASGLFLRAHEWNNAYDNDRTPSSPIAQVQGEQFASHSHSMGTAGAHTHAYDDVYLANTPLYFAVGNQSTPHGVNQNGPNVVGRTTAPAGDHTHTIYAAGGNETRPDNINLYIYIRVD